MFGAIFKPAVFLGVLSLLTAVAVGLQVPAIGKQVDQKADRQASDDLRTINYAIQAYEAKKSALPTSLNDIAISNSDVKSRLDDYEYSKDGTTKYKLCATFNTDTSDKKSPQPLYGSSESEDSLYYGSSTVDTTVHKSGKHCFDYQVSGSLYDDDYNDDLTNGYDWPSNPSSLQDKAKDTEIKSDIMTTVTYTEAYYNESGFYPSQKDLYDANWRKTNLKGFDEQATIGPNGEKLGSGYTHTPSPASCTNVAGGQCTSFTMSAKLSDGTTYSKKSLNN